ncbi:hypothetical protein I7I50_00652 [Histoplasma capsulatum G186AR]|uniref:Uncharacterized protein n=1 Tax=Ajellomyces capsulatus TaxID=5037 RepID=A0A8H8CU64_AJECA|nr:hypothetical protein I7I52_07920 [Histoplasma capsulatum]QSS72719.1 hypothetical protein I7I50_00652 [Histoplasma capsulatum G186AR]
MYLDSSTSLRHHAQPWPSTLKSHPELVLAVKIVFNSIDDYMWYNSLAASHCFHPVCICHSMLCD